LHAQPHTESAIGAIQHLVITDMEKGTSKMLQILFFAVHG